MCFLHNYLEEKQLEVWEGEMDQFYKNLKKWHMCKLSNIVLKKISSTLKLLSFSVLNLTSGIWRSNSVQAYSLHARMWTVCSEL